VHMGFRTPPAFLPLSGGGGGGPESGVHLFNGPDQRARINDNKGNSGPPPTFLPLSGGGGGSGIERSFPTAEILAPGSTTLARSHHPQLLSFKSTWGPLPCRVTLPFVHPPSSVYVVHPTCHHPLTTHRVTRSLPRQPPTKGVSIMCHLPSPPLISFCHVSSPITSLTPHRFLFHPCGCGPITLLLSPTFALASIPILQAIQLVQVAAREALHIPKVSSWPGHSQSRRSSY
jgi:hypothetical protein